MAQRLGFDLVHVGDLPHSARSVTDLENGRIYLPPASIPGGHGLRSMALQAIAHRLLDHQAPRDYAEFLQQRLEINYFAACCLMPRTQAVAFLTQSKADRDIAVEDFRDAFGVTHEAAALRLTNLATAYLDMTLHFLRVGDDGAVAKAYENDGLRLPLDVTGSAEGEIVCRHWSARRAFARTNRTTEYYQYTDTPQGTFFESTQIGTSATEEFSITIGVPFDDSKWFRGRETTRREQSRCPDASCCRRPPAELAAHWSGKSWSSAKVHAHIFSPLPSGTFPGVDDRELYEFLECTRRGRPCPRFSRGVARLGLPRPELRPPPARATPPGASGRRPGRPRPPTRRRSRARCSWSRDPVRGSCAPKMNSIGTGQASTRLR